MKKVGYFFFSFLPLIIVVFIQFLAAIFMMESTLVAYLIKYGPKGQFRNATFDLLTDSDFNGMIMIVYALIVIASFGIWYYVCYEGNYIPDVKKNFSWKMFFAIILLIPGTQFLSEYICMGIELLIPSWMRQYEELMETAGMGNDMTPILLIYSVILAPICEELIFRGVTLSSVKRALPFWAANIFQAVMFGAFHMNWVQGIYAFSIGLILGYIYEKGGSIYCSIFFHMLFNFWGTFASHFIKFDTTEIFFIISIPATVVSLLLGFILYRPKTLRIQNN